MSEFIVIGLVPGTQFQISFIAWVIFSLALLTLVAVKVHRKRTIRGWIVGIRLRLLMRQRIEY